MGLEAIETRLLLDAAPHNATWHPRYNSLWSDARNWDYDAGDSFNGIPNNTQFNVFNVTITAHAGRNDPIQVTENYTVSSLKVVADDNKDVGGYLNISAGHTLEVGGTTLVQNANHLAFMEISGGGTYDTPGPTADTTASPPRYATARILTVNSGATLKLESEPHLAPAAIGGTGTIQHIAPVPLPLERIWPGSRTSPNGSLGIDLGTGTLSLTDFVLNVGPLTSPSAIVNVVGKIDLGASSTTFLTDPHYSPAGPIPLIQSTEGIEGLIYEHIENQIFPRPFGEPFLSPDLPILPSGRYYRIEKHDVPGGGEEADLVPDTLHPATGLSASYDYAVDNKASVHITWSNGETVSATAQVLEIQEKTPAAAAHNYSVSVLQTPSSISA